MRSRVTRPSSTQCLRLPDFPTQSCCVCPAVDPSLRGQPATNLLGDGFRRRWIVVRDDGNCIAMSRIAYQQEFDRRVLQLLPILFVPFSKCKHVRSAEVQEKQPSVPLNFLELIGIFQPTIELSKPVPAVSPLLYKLLCFSLATISTNPQVFS